jgi:putative hydrolase of the HAD superfamily
VASSIQLVCFDLGRVLVRICSTWQEAFERAQIAPAVRELDEPTKSALRALVYASEHGHMSNDEFFRRAGEVFGVPAEHVAAMSNVFLLDVYPGVTELIDEIHSRGLRTACLSNTNANHWRLMSDPAAACCVPLERLTYQFGSHLIGARKPDPAIYAHVERVTASRGEQVIFFDDLPDNVAAARARGWHAYQIATDREPVPQIREHLSRHGVL